MTENPAAFFQGDPRLGQILKHFREQREISTQNIANALDVLECDVAQFENGQRPLSLAQLSAWLNILGVSPNLMFSLYDLGDHMI
jgi:transcriptional regulator with XRE-family HTH domain